MKENKILTPKKMKKLEHVFYAKGKSTAELEKEVTQIIEMNPSFIIKALPLIEGSKFLFQPLALYRIK